MKIELIDIKKLVENNGQIAGLPKNPRLIRDDRFKKLVKSIQDDPEMLDLRECLVVPHEDQFVVIAGNMRLKACKELGHKKIPCKVLDAETPVEKLRAYTVKDNVPFGEHDWDLLANEWDVMELSDWGLDLPETEEEKGEENYTTKIETPIYEPKNEKPKISELYNEELQKKLIQEISESNITDIEKNFLISAASRHVVFNYEKIADYYSHASQELQDLMEKSALVIVDVNKAIEYGFVNLSQEFEELIGNEK